MRKTITVYTVMLLLLGPLFTLMAQEPELGRAEQLVRSGDWRVRERGLALLLSIRKRLPDSGDKILFELLNRENEWAYQPRAEGDYIPEGFSYPYYTSLAMECLNVYRKQPDTKRYESLANSIYNGDSPFAAELGQDAIKHLNFIERLSQSPNQYVRLRAASLLVHALVGGKATARERPMVINIISGRLTDPSPEVRVPLAFTFSRLAGKEAHGALLAARDRLFRMEPRPTETELQQLEESILRSARSAQP